MFIIILISLLVIPLHTMGKPPRKIKAIDFVNRINNLKESNWKADTYGLSEIVVKDFAKNRLGLKLKKTKSKNDEVEKKNKPANAAYENHPVNFTWVPSNINDKYVNSSNTFDCPIWNINDQSNCGASWAVSTAAVFGDRLCLASNGTFNVPISANQIIACNKRNYGCRTDFLDHVLSYLKYNGTVTGGDYDSEEGCQPYSIPPCGVGSSTKMPCAFFRHLVPKCRMMKCTNKSYKYKEEKKPFKINSWKNLSSYGSTYIKQDIYQYGPILAGFYVYEDFIFYKSGIYEHTEGGFMGRHAVRVVGWGTYNGTNYWHVANSWGTDWGENGFFRIKGDSNKSGFFENSMFSLYTDGTIS